MHVMYYLLGFSHFQLGGVFFSTSSCLLLGPFSHVQLLFANLSHFQFWTRRRVFFLRCVDLIILFEVSLATFPATSLVVCQRVSQPGEDYWEYRMFDDKLNFKMHNEGCTSVGKLKGRAMQYAVHSHVVADPRTSIKGLATLR